MNLSMRAFALTAGLVFAAAAVAQAPAGAPAGSTGLCKDGSYWTGATKQGACHGHKGVQDWYAGTSSATPASVLPAPVVAAPVAAAAAPTPAVKATAAALPNASGAAGQVWVNAASKVYHCPGDRWYGKTKAGAYMSESQAVAQGVRPDHGKACH